MSEQTEKLRQMVKAERTVADPRSTSLIQHLQWLSQRVDDLEQVRPEAGGEGADDE